jgi:hypothetical protein
MKKALREKLIKKLGRPEKMLPISNSTRLFLKEKSKQHYEALRRGEVYRDTETRVFGN